MVPNERSRQKFLKPTLGCHSLACSAASGLLIAALSTEAKALELEEVTVTATKRGEISTQDLSFSIQAIGENELNRMGATGIDDIAAMVPGFTSFNAGSNQKKLKIRGISSSSESEPQETVAIYLNDIPITGFGGTNNENGASPDINLFDLSRVEVIKGPSGTLYGAGSLGGTVKYITNDPNVESFEGKADLSYSSVNDGDASYGGNVMLNLPVSDTFAVRFVGGHREIGGYIDNIVQTGVQNVPKSGPEADANSDSVTSYSLAAKWIASDRMTLTARYLRNDYEVDAESSLDANVGPKLAPSITPPLDALQQVRLIEEINEDVVDVYSFTLEYDFDAFSLTSSTSYMERETFDRQDTSIVPILFFGAAPAMLGGTSQIPAPLENDTEGERFVQELRLTSQGDQGVQWLVGLYYSALDKTFRQGGVIPGMDAQTGGLTALLGRADIPFESETTQTLDQTALFGEVVIPFGEKYELTLGGRYSNVEQDFRQVANGLINGGPSDNSGSSDEDQFNPRVSLAYHVSDDVMVYGGVSRGYRAGGINQPVPLDAGTGCRDELQSLGFEAAPGSFESDTVINYELGLKSTLADNRVRLNGAVYHIQWDDIQARRQLGCGFTFFANSAEAEVDGIEIDLEAQVSEHLLISATVGYVDSQLSKDDAFFVAQKGAAVPGVSDFTFSTALTYEFEIAGRPSFVRADYRYASEYDSLFNTNDPANRTAGGYGLLNLRAGYDITDSVDVSVFVKNLTDEIEVAGTQSNLFGDYVFVTRPREIGLKLQVAF